MEIAITYDTCIQTSPDDFKKITKVIHLNKSTTMEEAYKKIKKQNHHSKDFDGEIHFNLDEESDDK